MEQLPENSYDKAIIRLLETKQWPILDFSDDKSFLKLFIKGKYKKKIDKVQQ